MKSHPVNQRKKDSSPSVRTIIQILFLLATFLIGLRHLMPGESSKGGAFDAFCPFGGIETLWLYLTTGQTMATTNLLNFAVLLGVLGVSLLAGRAFCGWMCPVGTVQDLLAKDAEGLSTIPGIGPVTAQKLLDMAGEALAQSNAEAAESMVGEE